MSVKSRVIELCEQSNTKIGTLERETKMSNGTISKWTDESVPNGATLSAIADYFCVSVDYLLGRDGFAAEKSVDEELEMLHKNPELRTLLSASSKLNKDDIQFVVNLIGRMRGNE